MLSLWSECARWLPLRNRSRRSGLGRCPRSFRVAPWPIGTILDVQGLGVNVAGNRAIKVEVARQTRGSDRRKGRVDVRPSQEGLLCSWVMLTCASIEPTQLHKPTPRSEKIRIKPFMRGEYGFVANQKLQSFARHCFCVRPCSVPQVGSAPFPLFSRVILAPVFGCSNPGPTTLSSLNHEIKMTDHAVQADDQGCSGHP